ncbi:MAG: hypothetical protein NTW96_22040 [Planctomycetia bacterium]|nr:hypothetical protein [Planctomycetia bacterium]
MSYLANLMLRLAAGMAGLPEEARRRHAAYLAAAQGNDGGFAGRQGPGDCYYTSFALRALTLLDALDDRTAARAGKFLGAIGPKRWPPRSNASVATTAAMPKAPPAPLPAPITRCWPWRAGSWSPCL